MTQRRMRLHRGRSVGSLWGAACGCAREPCGAGLEGGSLAHSRSSGRRDRSGCCGCALPGAHGGDPPVCPRTARERARRGAARIRGACTAQLVQPWRAGPPARRSCASTTGVLCLHRGGLVPPPWSLSAAASLQRCYAAATGCSNAPVPSPIRGLLGPAVLVLQCVHHSPLAARPHAAVTAGAPQSRYQSRDYWSLQPLCRSLTAAASLQRCCAAAAAKPQSRHQSRGYWGLQSSCCSLCTTAYWPHVRMLCLHRGGLVPPQRRSGASTVESDCCSTSAALLCCSHWLR